MPIMLPGLSSPAFYYDANHTPLAMVVSSLFLNPEYSDLTIACGDKIFPVHKTIVCPRSKYFHRACFGDFRESNTSVIHLDDKDPWVILKVLEFMYKGAVTYDLHHPWNPNLPEDAESFQMNERSLASSSRAVTVESATTAPINPGKYYLNMRLWGEANYFMIEDLQEYLLDDVLDDSLREMISGGNSQGHPYRHDCLKDDTFRRHVREMYSTRCNYEGVRERFIRDLIQYGIPGYHRDHTRKAGPVIDSELLKTVPGFCHDLCQKLLERPMWGHKCDETLDWECAESCYYWREHWHHM